MKCRCVDNRGYCRACFSRQSICGSSCAAFSKLLVLATVFLLQIVQVFSGFSLSILALSILLCMLLKGRLFSASASAVMCTMLYLIVESQPFRKRKTSTGAEIGRLENAECICASRSLGERKRRYYATKSVTVDLTNRQAVDASEPGDTDMEVSRGRKKDDQVCCFSRHDDICSENPVPAAGANMGAVEDFGHKDRGGREHQQAAEDIYRDVSLEAEIERSNQAMNAIIDLFR